MRLAPIVCTTALLLAAPLAGPAAAQDAAPGEDAPAPEPEEQPEPEGEDPRSEEVDVERPEEIARIQAEIARIKAVREKLVGETTTAQAEVAKLKGEDLSPVLSRREEVVGLTLTEAIRQALERNPDYMIQLLAARAAHEQVPQEQATFDPVLSTTGTWSEGRRPNITGITGGFIDVSTALSVTTSLSWRLLTGTQFSLDYSEARNESTNPFSFGKTLAPSIQLTVTQPLLRDFGIDINRTGIVVAQNAALASDAALVSTYMSGVLAVEQAYWDLILAEGQLRAQERSLSSSIKFLDDQRKKLQHGAGTRLEVTIAKAGVASTREAVIVAENTLESARDQIIRLTDPSGDPSKWNRFVVPLDVPSIVPEPDLDPAKAIQGALGRRPDYLQALLDQDSARRNLELAENQVLPRLDFIATFREDGLGTGHHSAWSTLATGDFYSWSTGVRVELPLFLRAERARVRAAKTTLAQTEASLRALEATVVLEVRGAIRNVRTAKARIDAARASRVLAQERLEATRVQVETGTAVPRDVLDDLAELARAETNEIQAFINYRLAISQLKLSKGTLLDDWLEVLDPRVRAALERDPYRD
jgi:outer membrane protein TolC